MFPIALDLTRIPVLLVGSGELLDRRARFLQEAGATKVMVADHATEEAIRNATVVMVAGFPRRQAEAIAEAARAMGKLVNVEDVNDLCDFYFTANIRRGDLIIAVSTSGASPTLARTIRDWLSKKFGEEWAEHLREMLELRKVWKKQGASMKEVMDNTQRHVLEKGWLS